MVQNHVTAGLVSQNISKLLKCFNRFLTGDVGKFPHLYNNFSQKHFLFLRDIQPAMLVFD